MRIDFSKLSKILNNRRGNNVENSAECLFEFTSIINNIIEEGQKLTEEEMAFFIISMQNWIIRRNYTNYINKVDNDNTINIGEIFLADLGIAYKPEIAYKHPVIVIEKIKGYVLIVPTTSSADTLASAYHPVDNPNGDKKYLKLKATEDGVEKDCVAILTHIKTISKGRLISKKGKISDCMFNIIKDRTFYYSYPRIYADYYKKSEKISSLELELKTLKEENEKLKLDKVK